MAEHPETRLHSQPLRLLRNVTYPTYQLQAVAGRGKTPPATVLTICVLQTLAWLRSRFRDFEVPEALKWPEPKEHAQVNPGSFVSFRIDHGYKVEVVWLPEEQNWTMQLTEPDLGPDPGNTSARRSPVPGRLFETNIAFRIVGGEVECGFRTVVSDIEGTTFPCEVYRIAVIKHLARNRLVGLKQTWILQDEPHCLATVSAVQRLQEWLKDKARMMPAVIVAETIPEPVPQRASTAMADLPTLEQIKQQLGGHRHPPVPPLTMPDTVPTHLEPPPLPLLDRRGARHRAAALGCPETSGKAGRVKPPDDAEALHGADFTDTARAGTAADPADFSRYPAFVPELAHLKMGYAQVFLLPQALFAPFRKLTGRAVNTGEILLVEPIAFGGETVRYPRQRLVDEPDEVQRALDSLLQDYPKNKPMVFGSVLFLAQAKERERSAAIASVQSKEELLRAFDERVQAAEARHREELAIWESRCSGREEKIRRLDEQIHMLETDKDELRQHERDQASAYEAKLDERDAEILRLRAMLERPDEPAGIPGWVRSHLGDGMLFHARAEREITDVSPSEVNLPILCDALEFLATDYREQMLGRISQDECLQRCHRKYNRRFDIGPLKGTSIEVYAEDYTIRYGGSAKGKPAERLLDQHLAWGDRNKRLLRIYFLFDRERKLIVVGSLPKHLPTVSYK